MVRSPNSLMHWIPRKKDMIPSTSSIHFHVENPWFCCPKNHRFSGFSLSCTAQSSPNLSSSCKEAEAAQLRLKEARLFRGGWDSSESKVIRVPQELDGLSSLSWKIRTENGRFGGYVHLRTPRCWCIFDGQWHWQWWYSDIYIYIYVSVFIYTGLALRQYQACLDSWSASGRCRWYDQNADDDCMIVMIMVNQNP